MYKIVKGIPTTKLIMINTIAATIGGRGSLPLVAKE